MSFMNLNLSDIKGSGRSDIRFYERNIKIAKGSDAKLKLVYWIFVYYKFTGLIFESNKFIGLTQFKENILVVLFICCR